MAFKIAVVVMLVAIIYVVMADGEAEWPKGSYCIFMGGSGQCPPDFVKRPIRLSVPQNYSPSDKFRDGEDIITTGFMGASRLQAMSYEDVYVMDLKTCCREG